MTFEALDRTLVAISTVSPGVKGYLADLADPSSAMTLSAQVEHDFGRLDILVNNAAVAIRQEIEEITLESWETPRRSIS